MEPTTFHTVSENFGCFGPRWQGNPTTGAATRNRMSQYLLALKALFHRSRMSQRLLALKALFHRSRISQRLLALKALFHRSLGHSAATPQDWRCTFLPAA